MNPGMVKFNKNVAKGSYKMNLSYPLQRITFSNKIVKWKSRAALWASIKMKPRTRHEFNSYRAPPSQDKCFLLDIHGWYTML